MDMCAATEPGIAVWCVTRHQRSLDTYSKASHSEKTKQILWQQSAYARNNKMSKDPRTKITFKWDMFEVFFRSNTFGQVVYISIMLRDGDPKTRNLQATL